MNFAYVRNVRNVRRVRYRGSRELAGFRSDAIRVNWPNAAGRSSAISVAIT